MSGFTRLEVYTIRLIEADESVTVLDYWRDADTGWIVSGPVRITHEASA
jgi:hypothetical protein